MKTLRKTAEEAYLKYANKIINRETWIDGFISGIQYKKEYPQSIELCGLLWDTENLAIGGYEKDGHHYYTWQEASTSTRAASSRCSATIAPTASACVVYKTNNIYMKIFKYRLPSGKHILIYRSKDNKSSDYFQYVEEYTKKDIELPIFNEDTLFDTMQGKRTEDKILVENGIESIQDLSECYCQIRNKVSNLSKKVRDLVIKKYSDIINNYNFDK